MAYNPILGKEWLCPNRDAPEHSCPVPVANWVNKSPKHKLEIIQQMAYNANTPPGILIHR